MPDIVLTTLNAKYIHAAFGLRYLLANLGPLQPRAAIVEFDIHQRATDIVEVLLAREPRIIGIGVYIWNCVLSAEVVSLLKRVRPDITLVLGGPEVSFETEQQPICQQADYVITGEADFAFAELCGQLLTGERPPRKIIPAGLPDLNRVALPYDLYDERDIATRILYVEASRGCPFTCEFCLSSLDVPVRQVPLEPFFASLERLLDRGVLQFKFVDRTFNLNLHFSRAILEFFLARLRPGLFLHFEMVPDRLPAGLRELITRFPVGTLQFEVGIQSFNEEVCARIQRRQDTARLADNFAFLRGETGVHIHADLIAGLPGESLESFGDGFDRLIALRPQEIQVGILKRLRGTPIIRHDAEWEMVYSAHPPYEILRNKLLDFATMQRLRRFARYWDLLGNSGNFTDTTPLLWRGGQSPFRSFMRWSDWLHATAGRQHGIALNDLSGFLFRYLTEESRLDPGEAARALWSDYQRAGRSDRPAFLRPWLGGEEPSPRSRTRRARTAKRQARHLGPTA
jgi:radical SAM superfamily enzyme YgiQ (UPF0313 family)